MNTIKQLFRNRAVKVTTVVILLLTLIILFVSFLSNSFVIIKTNKNTAISIEPIGDSNTKNYLTRQGDSVVWLPVGKYRIVLSHYDQKIIQNITVSGFTFKTYTYSFDDTGGTFLPTPLLSVGVLSGVVSSDGAHYLNSQDNHIYSVTNTGIPKKINNNLYRSVVWNSMSHGIAQDSETMELVHINGVSVERFASPGLGFSSSTVFTVDQDGVVYFNIGRDIYKTGDYGKTFTKFYSSKSTPVNLYTSSNGKRLVVVESSKKSITNEDTNDGELDITIVSSDGKKMSEKNEISFYELAVSPNGEHIIVSGDAVNAIYSTNSFSTDNTIPIGNMNGIKWMNDEEIIYNDSRNVWQYNTTTGVARIIATVPLNEMVDGTFIDETSLFIISHVDSTLYRLSKIAVHNNKQQPDYVYTLGQTLPSLIDNCFINYNNISKPVIVIAEENCKNSAEYYKSINKIPVDIPIIVDSSR